MVTFACGDNSIHLSMLVKEVEMRRCDETAERRSALAVRKSAEDETPLGFVFEIPTTESSNVL